MEKNFRVIITNQDLLSISRQQENLCLDASAFVKFINGYSRVYVDDKITILLDGGDPAIYQQQVEHIINNCNKSLNLIIQPKLYFKANARTISMLNKVKSIVIPIRTDLGGPRINNWLQNMQAIDFKDKVIIKIDQQKFSQSVNNYIKVLQIISKLGFTKIALVNRNYDCTHEKFNFTVVEIVEDFQYTIDVDGVISKAGTDRKFSIYKPICDFVFG